MRQFLAIFGVVLLFMAAVGGVYMYQQRRIADLEAKIESLGERLADEESKATEPQEDRQPLQGSYASEKGVNIVVTNPTENSSVVSPLEVNGTVPGSWSFEGNVTVKLLDSEGTVITQQPATISGEWMTESMVPFSAVLIFSSPNTETGSLVLEKANPSDLPENADSLTIPIQF